MHFLHLADITENEMKEKAAEAAANGIHVHALNVGAGFNPADEAASRRTHIQALRLAHAYGSEVVTLGCGGIAEGTDTIEGLKKIAAYLNELSLIAWNEYGIRLSVEAPHRNTVSERLEQIKTYWAYMPERLQSVAKRFGGADAGRSADSSNAGAPFAGETYVSFDEMLKKADMDAVYIATPIPAHADMVVQALNADKHVVSEVICATTLEDCQRIKDAIAKSGRKYMMAEQYCFIRPWSIVMNMVKAGLFGEIYYAEGDYLMNFHQRAGFPYVGNWRQNVYHMHRGHVYITHSLGPLMQAFDYEPLERVSCMGSGSYPHSWGLRADNTCNLLLHTKSKKLIRLREDFLSLRPDNYLFYAIQGVNGVYEGGRSYPGAYHEGDRREKQEYSHKVSVKGLCGPNEWIDLFSLKEFLPDMSEGWLPDEEIRKYGVYNEGVGVMFNDFASIIMGQKENELTLKRCLNWTAAGLRSEESADRDGDPVAVPVY